MTITILQSAGYDTGTLLRNYLEVSTTGNAIPGSFLRSVYVSSHDWGTFSPPAGWTEEVVSDSSPWMWVGHKVNDASGVVDILFSGQNSTRLAAYIWEYSGVLNSNPVDVSISGGALDVSSIAIGPTASVSGSNSLGILTLGVQTQSNWEPPNLYLNSYIISLGRSVTAVTPAIYSAIRSDLPQGSGTSTTASTSTSTEDVFAYLAVLNAAPTGLGGGGGYNPGSGTYGDPITDPPFQTIIAGSQIKHGTVVIKTSRTNYQTDGPYFNDTNQAYLLSGNYIGEYITRHYYTASP